MRYLLPLLLSFYLAHPASAQGEDWTLQRQFELPAHRSLMALVEGAELAPFETDGCSGGLSLAWRSVSGAFPDFAAIHEEAPPWEACCVIHDRAYHDAGGGATPGASFDARLVADEALRACVVSEGEKRRDLVAEEYGIAPERIDSAYATIAEAMFVAVRFGGGPCTGLPWRWGYGFPQCTPVPIAGQGGSGP
ncbi:MAG: hypothetical protein AAGG56_05940 [Pseudomonadota bacterium]